MKRRAFITLLGGAAAAWPLAARAQRATPVIGFLMSGSPGEMAHLQAAFRRGLGEVGFVERQNVAIDSRWAEGRYDQLPALVAEFVRPPPVDVIFAGGPPAATAAKAATTTIPIVFTSGVDPVKLGLVASFSRPGGNITGVSMFFGELGAKRLELLRELVPKAHIVAVLLNPTSPEAETQRRDVTTAAHAIGQQLIVLNAANENAIDAAFATIVEKRVEALLVGSDPYFLARRTQILALATRHAVPAIYQSRDMAEAGGLMSYGINNAEAYRQAGIYSGKILKGDKPAELPIIEPTKFELIINLKTAKALSIEVPAKLLALADEVIE
jgi:putative ABC transport system substrate-binding protein